MIRLALFVSYKTSLSTQADEVGQILTSLDRRQQMNFLCHVTDGKCEELMQAHLCAKPVLLFQLDIY